MKIIGLTSVTFAVLSTFSHQASALWTPLATKFNIYEDEKSEFSIETDFNIGYQIKHVGKPSDYQELKDEFLTSINAKQWLKLNINIYDIFIKSFILEFTWFEFQPLKLQSFFVEPEDFPALVETVKHFKVEDM